MAFSKEPDSFWKPFALNNGQYLPAIGLGTFRIKDRETIFKVVDAALRAGYRSFDTAAVYGNELFIGEALNEYLPKYDLTHDDIYITSKLSNADHGSKQRVLDAFAKTKKSLGFTPDLYLIHFPGSAKLDPKDKRNMAHRHSAWSAMAQLYDTGSVDSIGVSNFTVPHLEQLLKEYHSDIPVVNQVEWHPYFYDEDLLRYCNKQSIQLQGYHSLGGTGNSEVLLQNQHINRIADDHAVGPAQVLLTWSLQRGVAVIPKSISPQHIWQNIKLNFKLTQEQMNTLDTLTQTPTKFAWDPRHVI